MEIYIAEHCKSLAESCILGLIFGAGYDIIRVLYVLLGIRGKAASAPKIWVAFLLYLAGDLAYMLAVTISASVFLYHSNYGQFRLFLLFGCLSGFFVYQKTIGRLVMAAAETIVKWLKLVALVLVFQPVCKIIGTIGRMGSVLIRITAGRVYAGLRYCVCGWRMRRCMKQFRELVKLQKL